MNCTFKPHQSRAYGVITLPQIVWARDSFPTFGEAKGASDFIICLHYKKNFLALSKGGEGAVAHKIIGMAMTKKRDGG